MTDQEFFIKTSRYRVIHRVKEPSRVTDYDYDWRESDKRFITTYLHTLEFYDVLTNAKIYELNFSSETCAEILLTIYKVLAEAPDLANYHKTIIVPTTVPDNIYLHVTFNLKFKSILDMRITNSCTCMIENTNLFFYGEREIQAFIDLLETERVVGMFVTPSSDRW